MSTIKEIAEKANVSIGTVDRVIHGRGRVSSETGKRVQQVIKELNYKPNLLARQLRLGKTYYFGVLLPQTSQDSRYWERPIVGIQKAQKELERMGVKIHFFHYDRYSESSFIDSGRRALLEELHGLLIAPVILNVAVEVVKQVPDDIPYAFFDSYIPGTKCFTFIGQDPYTSGRLAAKLMKMLVKESNKIAIIRMLPEDFHIDERVNGFRSLFSKYSEEECLVYDADVNDHKTAFSKLCKKIIGENKDLGGVFITNALTHRVAEFLESHPVLRKIYLIGYDLIDENVEYLRKDFIDFLISQKPSMQGYQGIYSLYRKIILKENVAAKLYMPIDIITKENIDFYGL
jgi:LacI family transcriptional regulator